MMRTEGIGRMDLRICSVASRFTGNHREDLVNDTRPDWRILMLSIAKD